jgi:hypothetical protein
MAKRSKSKLVKLGRAVSPKGIAAWAYLTEPAEGYGGGDDEHKITVFLKKKADDFAPFLAKLNEARKALAKEKGCKPSDITLPLKQAKEKQAELEGVEVGDPYIEFKSKPREKNGNIIPIPVVGADAKKTDTDVWGGDIVRVQCNLSGWEMPSPKGMTYGIKAYLSGVQLLKSNRSSGGGTDLFDADEAFAAEEGSDDLDLDSLEDEDFDFDAEE